ncbi:transcriptional regulator [Chlorobium sp. BLA1]|nr:transcriptional regulator [Candidatus Chlorobium masyuteum]
MLTKNELNTRSKTGSKLFKSANQTLDYARGNNTEGFVTHVPEGVDIKTIRNNFRLTQPEFSARFGFELRSVQDWKLIRLQPQRSARILLTVFTHEPAAVRRALKRRRMNAVNH